MRKIAVFSFLIVSNVVLPQSTQSITPLFESEEAQRKLDEEYLDVETSILEPEDFKNFDGLKFYPLDSKYIVKAEFVRTPDEKPFLMPTSTSRLPEYVKYGEAHFTIDGKGFTLNLYKSTEQNVGSEYVDYLFLPFTDLTSGVSSYGGGRYLDLKIPEGDTIIIDFNKAYNPYCAYNSRYSCPIPPEENDILVRIEAGVKNFIKP